MFKNNDSRIIFVDLLGLQAHSNYLTSLYEAGEPIIDHVYATNSAIDWSKVSHEKGQTKLQLQGSLFVKIKSFFNIVKVILPLGKKVFIAGCPTFWHIIIAVTASPSCTFLMIHNEFLKIYNRRSIGANILRLVFWIYRLRGFKLAVMSRVMRNNIIKRGLYPSELLYVITHPLPESKNPLTFSAEGSINLIGFLRPQKLKGVINLFSQLQKENKRDIRVFGRYLNKSDVTNIEPYCDSFDVRFEVYTKEEETSFLEGISACCFVFCPDENYELLTSGSVIDCVRHGCYCLLTSFSAMAEELIGPLVIYNLSESLQDPKNNIELLVKNRRQENLNQISTMLSENICLM